MTKENIAVVLALSAALLSALGSVIRQRSAHEIVDRPVGAWELFRLSLRDTRWWLGGAAAVTNRALQIAALGLGSVMLVTALQVTKLLFALPINARITHRRVTAREWFWAASLAVAVAVIIVVGHPTSDQQRAPLEAWVVAALVMGPALVLCVLGARIWSGAVAAILLAVVAGSSSGLFAVLAKGAVDAARGGFGALLRAPELYALFGVALASMVFQQASFRAGALTASLPTMTLSKPVVGWILALTVLSEHLHVESADIVVLVAALAVMIVSTVALSRGEAAGMAALGGRRSKVAAQSPAPSER
ncbi:DMT family transporter [Candidatus Mycobacterium methanotrophicum]|uniref:DMT family transporter n=1 Tax=Candidatus Mycobacterium methanotrophicum TaxID=2943498 RepID=A0ABY4QIJ3_9MYCO|nr:DMT family transporter [Candidatus Mycobacterium methanotrophicum]UQX10163.1 DMT family transporter [Candidatus Mycobacterium methanotrophicum]